MLWPVSKGYDEVDHVEMAYMYSLHPFHFYAPGRLLSSKADIAMYSLIPTEPAGVRLADLKLPPRSARPTLAQLGAADLVPGTTPDQMVQHPPLYYWLGAVVLRVPGVAGLSWDLQVWLMRLLSVALMAPVPIVAWATTRRLAGAWGRLQGLGTEAIGRLALVGAAVPLTVPNLIRDGSSVTNDALLISATSVALYLMARIMTGDLSKRTAGWLALVLAAALWTKGFALVLPPLVVASYLIGASRQGQPWYRGFWKPLGIVAVGGVVGGIWWIRNLIDYGVIQPNGYGGIQIQQVFFGSPDNTGTLIHFIPAYLSSFVAEIWGGVGYPDLPLPGPLITYGWFFAVLTGMLAALFAGRERLGRTRISVMVAATVLSFLVAADGSFGTFRHWSHMVTGSSARYIYETVVAVASVASIGWIEALQPRFRRVLFPAVVVGAVATNAAVWVMLLRSWYQPTRALTPFHGISIAWQGLLRISPLPPAATTALVGILPVAFSIATISYVVREAIRARTTSGSRPLSEVSLTEVEGQLEPLPD